jgi:AcrR family transcriptional regulator
MKFLSILRNGVTLRNDVTEVNVPKVSQFKYRGERMGVSARKKRETEALREQVLDTAEDIFVREGVDQVTMRRIAASVDYAPTLLYRLFANKADLLDHLIARGYKGVRDQYAVIMQQQGLSSQARLKSIVATYVDYALTHPNHYRMWFDTCSIRCEEGQLLMNHGRLEYVVFQVWLDGIESCQAEGMFAGWDSLDVFQLIWSRVHGLISLRLQCPDLPWVPVADHLEEVLTLSLSARE